MKKIYLTLLVVLATMLYACETEQGQGEEEFVTISLRAGGELKETQTPLTRGAESRALYGIQINATDGKDEIVYAHGLFDDLANVTVQLAKNKTYNMDMTYIPNAKDVIHYYGDKDPSQDYWELPFNSAGWTNTPLNVMQYGPNQSFTFLSGGENTPKGYGNDRSHSWHNEVDRYYGVLKNYVPKEGGTATISMKRCVFGLTFRANRIDGQEYKKLLIQLDADADCLSLYPKKYYLTIDQTTATSELVIPLICMWEPGLAIQSNDYTESFKISIGTDNNPSEIYFGDITIKRNTMHTFEFDAMKPEIIPNGLVSDIENSPMMDGETVDLN